MCICVIDYLILLSIDLLKKLQSLLMHNGFFYTGSKRFIILHLGSVLVSCFCHRPYDYGSYDHSEIYRKSSSAPWQLLYLASSLSWMLIMEIDGLTQLP
jgi:hypothetical protein